MTVTWKAAYEKVRAELLALHDGDEAAAFSSVVARVTCSHCGHGRYQRCVAPHTSGEVPPHAARIRAYLALPDLASKEPTS